MKRESIELNANFIPLEDDAASMPFAKYLYSFHSLTHYVADEEEIEEGESQEESLHRRAREFNRY